MFDLKEEQQQLALSESHILALQERAAALGDRVDQLLKNGKNAQAQSELLCTMLDVLKNLEYVRSQITERMSRGSSGRQYASIPSSGHWLMNILVFYLADHPCSNSCRRFYPLFAVAPLEEFAMLQRAAVSITLISVASLAQAHAPAFDTSPIQKATGIKGTYHATENVYKVSKPRARMAAVDGWIIPPFLGTSSYAAFSHLGYDQVMVMGDNVLFEDEVGPTSGAISGRGSSGCVVSGNRTPRAKGNVYTTSVTLGGSPCLLLDTTLTSASHFDAATKRLYAVGMTSARDNGMIFAGAKP